MEHAARITCAQERRAILIAAPSVAYDPNLPRLAGRYCRARCSGPVRRNQRGSTGGRLVARYQEAFGSSPDVFAAFAHDAYKFLVRAAVDQGANTRELV